MMYSVQRVNETRLAIVLVEKKDLAEPRASGLIKQLQDNLDLPVILVARDSETCTGVRARATFAADPNPYVYALLGVRDLEWSPIGGTYCVSEEPVGV